MQAMELGYANGATKSLWLEYLNFIQKLQVFIAFLKYCKVANSIKGTKKAMERGHAIGATKSLNVSNLCCPQFSQKTNKKSLSWASFLYKILRIVIFCSSFGRIEYNIIPFWDFLTFKHSLIFLDNIRDSGHSDVCGLLRTPVQLPLPILPLIRQPSHFRRIFLD